MDMASCKFPVREHPTPVPTPQIPQYGCVVLSDSISSLKHTQHTHFLNPHIYLPPRSIWFASLHVGFYAPYSNNACRHGYSFISTPGSSKQHAPLGHVWTGAIALRERMCLPFAADGVHRAPPCVFIRSLLIPVWTGSLLCWKPVCPRLWLLHLKWRLQTQCNRHPNHPARSLSALACGMTNLLPNPPHYA